MMTPSSHGLSQEEHRLQAVLALFRGEKASDVSASSGICRSDLYKFRTRALAAMREALKDHPRGPKRPHNRLAHEREQKVVASANAIRLAVPIKCAKSWGQTLPVRGRFNACGNGMAWLASRNVPHLQLRHDGYRSKS